MKSLTPKIKIIIYISIAILICGTIIGIYFTKHRNNPKPASAPSQSIAPTTLVTSIEGRVINENNEPVKDAIIDWKLYSSSDEINETNATTTNQDGKYVIENIPEGKKQILAYKDNLAAVIDFTVKKDQKNIVPDLKLLPSGALEGICRDKTNNSPLSGVNVKIKVKKWADIEIIRTTDTEGKYSFPAIAVDSYTIEAQKNDFDSSSNQIDITNSQKTISDFYLSPKTNSSTATTTNTISEQSINNSSNNSTDTNSSNTNTTDNTPSSQTSVDGTYSVKNESISLAGYSVTVYRPDNNNTYPGILLLNGFSGETLAKYGYYVASIEPESTEAAGSIIDAMKAKDECSDKVGVTGFSWGGAMSMEIGAKTKKASAVFEMAGLLLPENNIDLATDMPCPVYFITGENDELAKPADVQAMYDKLRSGGQSGEIYIVPGEGHGYSDSAMNTLYGKAFGFFNNYLH